MSAKRYEALFPLNIPVRAWTEGEGVTTFHSEHSVCLSLLYCFLVSLSCPRTITSA